MKTKLERIYIDLDGVLANMSQHFISLYNEVPGDYIKKHGIIDFWAKAYETPDFFLSIPIFDYAHDLVSICQSIAPVTFLTSPTVTNREHCVRDKRKWVDVHFGSTFPVIFERHKEVFSGPGKLLIDDTKIQIDNWGGEFGSCILFTGYDDCIKRLVSFNG